MFFRSKEEELMRMDHQQNNHVYKTLKIQRKNQTSNVFHLYINRPLQRNSLSLDFFTEYPHALSSLDHNPDVAVIVLSGTGDHFSAGVDLKAFPFANGRTPDDPGRQSELLRRQLKLMQDAITAIERCRKPVIAAIRGACIGAGVDIVTACDMRFCTRDSFFQVKEIDLGVVSDLGSLQRLPGIVGYGNAMELALTGRRLSGQEAKELSLVSRVFGSAEELEEGVRILAEEIAAKSPLAVTGTKAILLRTRDLNVDQGLDYVATWNSIMLFSNDTKEAVSAQMQKRKPTFAKL